MVGRDVRERERTFWSGALALNGERGRYHRESVRAQLFHPAPKLTLSLVFLRVQQYSTSACNFIRSLPVPERLSRDILVGGDESAERQPSPLFPHRCMGLEYRSFSVRGDCRNQTLLLF